MNANELIARAQGLCRALGRLFPTELKAYASDWQRQRYDLDWCWGMVRSALRERRSLWQVEAQVRRHHARLQSEKDSRDLKAGELMVTTLASGPEDWWVSQDALEDMSSPASAIGFPDGPDGLRPSAEPRQTCRAPRQPYRKRTGTKTHKIRELLKAHVVRRGPASVRKLESMAKAEGLLEYDQAISRSSSFRRVMKELGVESHRVGYGPGASYMWRFKPPAWTRGLDLGVHD
jgi:hypothetical protein